MKFDLNTVNKFEHDSENYRKYKVLYRKYGKEDVLSHTITDVICKKCGELLNLSDLPKYDYVCYNCEENFFSCEVE